MHELKRDNPTIKRAKPLRNFPHNLLTEYTKGFRAGLYALHDSGRTWEKVSEDVGISETMIDKFRKGESIPKLPAFIFLADALNISLIELLALGQEEE